MDINTGRSRGTGFVCFWNKEDANKAVEKSEMLRLETTGTIHTVGDSFSCFLGCA
jgi:nucleolar protein 4